MVKHDTNTIIPLLTLKTSSIIHPVRIYEILFNKSTFKKKSYTNYIYMYITYLISL